MSIVQLVLQIIELVQRLGSGKRVFKFDFDMSCSGVDYLKLA